MTTRNTKIKKELRKFMQQIARDRGHKIYKEKGPAYFREMQKRSVEKRKENKAKQTAAQSEKVIHRSLDK